mmetsp:Transcript_12479/g.35532  ORF Transcript_12479/g.35532 Transcript_12479/m.35532 type:complete len:284 (+) Transcript_12479:1455-2306(+)
MPRYVRSHLLRELLQGCPMSRLDRPRASQGSARCLQHRSPGSRKPPLPQIPRAAGGGEEPSRHASLRGPAHRQAPSPRAYLGRQPQGHVGPPLRWSPPLHCAAVAAGAAAGPSACGRQAPDQRPRRAAAAPQLLGWRSTKPRGRRPFRQPQHQVCSFGRARPLPGRAMPVPTAHFRQAQAMSSWTANWSPYAPAWHQSAPPRQAMADQQAPALQPAVLPARVACSAAGVPAHPRQMGTAERNLWLPTSPGTYASASKSLVPSSAFAALGESWQTPRPGPALVG